MKASQIVAAICVLGAVFATAAWAAADAQQASNEAQNSQAGPSSYYERADVKHLCLKEAKQYNCRTVGCPRTVNCAGDCRDCIAHSVYQSDLTCCDSEEYGHNHHEKYAGDTMFTPDLADTTRVGTCDWDFDIYKCNPDNTAGTTAGGECRDPIQMENGAYKIGTAWATCYLNDESEKCGHPFCDKMVLTFQGGVYGMQAYAKRAPVAPETDGCDIQLNTTSTAARKDASGKAQKMTALKQALYSTDLLSKLKAQHKSSAARHPANNSTTSWQVGLVAVFSGTVTVTSLERRVEYSRGMMEYVALWTDGQALPASSSPGYTAMVVEPYTYDIVLVENGKDEE